MASAHGHSTGTGAAVPGTQYDALMGNEIAANVGLVPLVPRTPSQRARDLIFAYQGSQLALLLVGLIFIFVGGSLTLVFDWRLPAELAIELGGQPATGHVSQVQLERNVTVNGRHPTALTFTYDVGGTRHTGLSSTINPAVVAAAQPGADVPIEVARLNPKWARVRGTTISILGLWGLFMLIMPSLGLLLLALAVRSNRREIRAFIHGQPIVARVVFAGPDRTTRINGRNPLLVRWEFMLEGRTFKGSISSLKLPLIEPLMKQQELVVLYDPQNPKINTCYVD
jgi:hypothetical protein